MINLFVSSLDHLSATSYYRTWGNANFYKVHKIKLYEMPRKLDWRAIQDINIAYFERPHRKEDVEAMIHLKRQGVPIWIDYDDNLFDVQPENPAFQFYDDRAKEGVHRCIQIADVVTVSTEQLKEVYRKDSVVIRNALRPEMYDRPVQPRDNYIVWRGGLSHAGDLFEYWEDIKKISKDYQILLLGGVPDFAKFESKTNQNIKIVPPMRLEDYFMFLHTINPKCFIVPLSDNVFNRGKSNIAYLEALVTGAMTVAPNWEEWQSDAIVNYKSPQDSVSSDSRSFLSAVEIAMQYNYDAKVYDAIEKERLMYQQENVKRLDIIETLVGGSL